MLKIEKPKTNSAIKVLALFSGGLDSSLAIKVILEQGIDVIALNFTSSFCRCDSTKQGCSSAIKSMANQLGVDLKVVYLGQDYLDMIKNPKHGYGKNLNPCIDCRIFKFKKAKEIMQEQQANFLITGEVLGQRPMSQHRRALEVIEKEAGLEGLILRPLSAKLFPETIAESRDWVDREKLLGISGRGRRPQMNLAKEFGIKDYPCPAGGCLLTDPAFSRRVKDALEHNDFNIETVEFLKTARFFRINPSFSLYVGRDEKENAKLVSMAKNGDYVFETTLLPGPAAVGRGLVDEQVKNLCCSIIAWYTSKEKDVEVEVTKVSDNTKEIVVARAIEKKELEKIRR